MRDDEVRVEETSRHGAVREFSVRAAAAHVEKLVAEELASLGRSVRLPGFRPGRIPAGVLDQRYGSRARGEVIRRLLGELVPKAMPDGAMLSSSELVNGSETGDLEWKLTIVCLRDLPEADFSDLCLERLLPVDANPQSSALADAHLKRQVLDHLATLYEFPVAPLLVERELAAIRRAADADPALRIEPGSELEDEFRAVAERRVRLGPVVAETARVHGIRVAAEDVTRERRRMSAEARAGESPAQTRGRLLEERVIAWIVSRARVRERSVSSEELSD